MTKTDELFPDAKSDYIKACLTYRPTVERVDVEFSDRDGETFLAKCTITYRAYPNDPRR